MSALGLLLLGFGVLTAWAALDKVNVFDLMRSFIGAPVPARSEHGALK